MTQETRQNSLVVSSRLSAADLEAFQKLCRKCGTNPCAALRQYILEAVKRGSTQPTIEQEKKEL